jgi:hypothetical protein
MYKELLEIVRSDSVSNEDSHSNATQATALTSQLPDLDVEREDFDDEEIEAMLSNKQKPSNEFTFVG